MSGGTSTTATYGYDNDGNMTNDNGVMTNDNGVAITFDARDEQVSDSSGDTYTYSPDGDMSSEVTGSGTTYSYSSDAYGQQIDDASSSVYTWDALDRLVGASEQETGGNWDTIGLTYDGMTDEVASDSSATYSRDPAGQLTGVDSTSGGQNIALDDGHDDLSGTFAAAGTSMASSTTYNPWGTVLASTGSPVQVGYQGQWTDPVSQQVNMGSRMYRTTDGDGAPGFVNKDTGPSGSGVAVTDDAYAYADDNPVSVTDPAGHSPSGGGGSSGPSAGAVASATGRAAAAGAKAAAAEAAYDGARTAANVAKEAAHGAAALARELNTVAAKLAAAASKAAQLAAQAFKAAQAELKVAESWQDKADGEWETARADADKALHTWPWDAAGDLYDAAKATAAALYDEARAAAAMVEYGAMVTAAAALAAAADVAKSLAEAAALAAKGAERAAEVADKAADAASGAASALGEVAAADEAVAAQDADQAKQLATAFAHEVVRKVKAIAHAVKRAVKKAAKVLGHAAKVVAKAVYKYSGAQDVVSCVTDPTLAGCAKAVATVALVAATGGEGELEVAGVEAAEDAGTEVAEHAAGDAAGEDAAGDASSDSCPAAGGESFTAGTMVLLANGEAVPISSLHVGELVLATNTKTGKTQPEAVAAVLVRHDTDLYDLKVKDRGRTSVIDTTSNHLFWVPSLDYGWIPANRFKPGMHLKTPDGQSAVVVGGSVPAVHDGWMWDLTVPGDNDHDFYVAVAATAVLVDNCGDGTPGYSTRTERAGDLPGKYTQGQSTRDPASQWYHEMLSNDDLLGSINNADEGEGIVVSQEGRIIGGNHRMDELLTRVGDGRIGPETPIMIQVLGDG